MRWILFLRCISVNLGRNTWNPVTITRVDFIQGLSEKLLAPTCPITYTKLENTPVEQIPDRPFLLPILKWGPNNQISGLYEALFAVNQFNLNLALPPFHFHQVTNQFHNFTDGKLHNFVPPEIYISHQSGSNNKNIFTFEDFKNKCGSNPDAVILASDPLFNTLKNRIFEFQRITGIEILSRDWANTTNSNSKHKVVRLDPNIAVYPGLGLMRQPDKKQGIHFVTTHWEEIFQRALENGHQCILFVLPFRIVHYQDLYQQIYENASLGHRVLKFSPLISEIGEKFFAEKLKSRLSLGLHWRYNQGDWSRRCEVEKTIMPHEECGVMGNIDFKKLSQILVNLAETDTFIYVAAPLTEIDTVKKLANHSNDKNIKFIFSDTLLEFFKQHYQACEWYEFYLDDVISLVEQHLLYNSVHFLLWPKSSWSSRISRLRGVANLAGRTPRLQQSNLIDFLKQSVV